MIYARRFSSIIALAMQSGFIASPVLAQEIEKAAADSTLGDIVVTAEKRESSIQRTPLAITAIGGADLAKKGISSIEQIGGVVPGVAVNNESGVVKVNIRGLGLNAFGPATEGNVAVYIGGVYLAHPQEIGAQFLDVQRMEVLRGPQGTLYGRNSTGGAINVIPNAPTNDFEAGGIVSYGNYKDLYLSGYASGAVTPDVLKVRIAGQYQKRNGYTLNLFNGDHYDGLQQGGIRGTIEYTPSDTIKLTVAADYFHGQDTSITGLMLGRGRTQAYAQQLVSKALDPVAAAAAAATITTQLPVAVTDFGGVTNPVDANGRSIDPSVVILDTAPYSNRTYWGGSAILEVKVSPDITVKSISSYRHGEYSNLYDGDRTTAFLFNYNQLEQWRTITEELQILGKTGRLSWIVGGYYLNDKEPLIAYILPTAFGTFNPLGSGSTKAYAVFGQATYALTSTLKFTLGGRYGYEVRRRTEFLDITSPDALQPDRISFSKFTPRATLVYEPNRDLTIYATVSQGFKSGGFLVTAGQGPINPETLWDYEAGVKARLLDNHLQINVSAYHYDYKNLQVPISLGLVVQTQNAASATIDGGEIEIVASPIDNLRISASGTLIDGKFKKFVSVDPVFPELGPLNLKGNRLPFNSKYAFFIEGKYTIPLPSGDSIELAADYNWRGKRYFDAYNLDNTAQKSVGEIDARMRYSANDSRWFVEVFGKNLTNEFIVSQASTDGSFAGQQILAQREPPRTYGIRLGFNY